LLPILAEGKQRTQTDKVLGALNRVLLRRVRLPYYRVRLRAHSLRPIDFPLPKTASHLNERIFAKFQGRGAHTYFYVRKAPMTKKEAKSRHSDL